MEGSSNMRPNGNYPMAGDSTKSEQGVRNPRGEKRSADGTIKAQVEPHPPVEIADEDIDMGSAPNSPRACDMDELSGGYEPEDEFAADEMEEDDDEEEEEENKEAEDEDKKGNPDQDSDPDPGNGANGGAGNDSYDGDSDDSGAYSDFNFGDCESNGDPILDSDSEVENRDLDDVDYSGYGDLNDSIPDSNLHGRVWIPDEASQALIDNGLEDDDIFQDDAFQYPGEGSSASENITYYEPNDLYYEGSDNEEVGEGEVGEEAEGTEAVEETEEHEEGDIEEGEEVEEAEKAAVMPANYIQLQHGIKYEDDPTYPHPMATEDMNTWYTDPTLAVIDSHLPSDQPVQGPNEDSANQVPATQVQPPKYTGQEIWEDMSEDEQDRHLTPIVMQLYNIPATGLVLDDENKENKYPQTNGRSMESHIPNGILEENAPESASSHAQPWTGRYSPAEDREYRPLSFGGALRPVPSLAGRVPVLNVNPNGPRTQVHEWYSQVGAHIQDIAEETFPTVGTVRRAHSPPAN
ncbi:hypothetical protein FQN49_004733 [Arthroderma sp. PD_2]|nr:hypothetical protein FQN49_004733 [Arthroderma sp. PD_2]